MPKTRNAHPKRNNKHARDSNTVTSESHCCFVAYRLHYLCGGLHLHVCYTRSQEIKQRLPPLSRRLKTLQAMTYVATGVSVLLGTLDCAWCTPSVSTTVSTA